MLMVMIWVWIHIRRKMLGSAAHRRLANHVYLDAFLHLRPCNGWMKFVELVPMVVNFVSLTLGTCAASRPLLVNLSQWTPKDRCHV